MSDTDTSSKLLQQLLAAAEKYVGSVKSLVSTDNLIQAVSGDGHYIILTQVNDKPLVIATLVSPQHNVRSIALEVPSKVTLESVDHLKWQLSSFLQSGSVSVPKNETFQTRNDAPESQISQVPPQYNPQSSSRRPNDMPDFDDEYETRTPMGSGINPQTQIDTNDNKDLYPGGVKYPSIKPYLDPTAGSTPSATGGGAIIGGGMMPTPNDRLFGHPKSSGGRIGGVPPGARYDDPYGEESRSMPGATNTLYGSNIPGDAYDPAGSLGFGRRPGGGGGAPGFGGGSLPGFGSGSSGFGFGSGSGSAFGNF